MEKIASDLKASETKQRSLGKTYEALHSQASSMLVLSIQWKDLQEHFDSTRNAIQTCFEELQEREKVLEAKELKFKSEMESKTDELCGVQKLVDEKVKEVIKLRRFIQKHSEEIEHEHKRALEVHKLIVDKEKECGVIERKIQERTKKLNWLERRIEEKSNEIELKEKELNKYYEDIKVNVEQLDVIGEAIVKGKVKIESKEEEIRAAQMLLEELERRIKSKEEKLSWIEKSIEDTSKMANSKEEEVRVIQGSLNVCRESIKSKEGELDAIIESIEGKKKEFDVKEEQTKTLQRLIEGCEKELKLKEEKLKEETLKVTEFSLRNRPMEEWSCKLELKGRELELKEKQIESKREEFKKWAEECGKELNSLSSELKVKEVQLQHEVKELELAKKQCGIVAQVNNVIVPSSAKDQDDVVAQHEQAIKLFRDLGTTDKAPDCSNIVENENPETSAAKNEATNTSPNLQHTARTIDVTHLQGNQNEQFESRHQVQEQITLKARLQVKQEQKASNKIEKRKQLQEQTSRVEQQEQQKTSKAKLQEKVEQKASDKVVEEQQQEEQYTSKAKLQEKVEQKASDKVEEQRKQEQNASIVKKHEQPKQKKGRKRSNITFAPRFDHQQQFQNKFQRTSIVADRPVRLHPDHLVYPNSSSSTWPQQRYGYHGENGTAVFNYRVDANYGHPVQFGVPVNRSADYGYGGHNPRLNQSYPYPRPAPQ